MISRTKLREARDEVAGERTCGPHGEAAVERDELDARFAKERMQARPIMHVAREAIDASHHDHIDAAIGARAQQ